MIRPFDDAAVTEAARLIRAGEPVAIATETVYGLAADATSDMAVARVYAAKGRPAFNPLIVHVATAADAEALAPMDGAARALARRFWPGPLSMVLTVRRGSGLSPLVTAGLMTVAIRVPAHPAMRQLLTAARLPLAAPSANASGAISATTAAHVAASLGDRVALIVDAGPAKVGIESTIVAVEPGRLRLLRPGPIDGDALAAATGLPIVTSGTGAIEAPGQLASHYAPTKPLRLDATAARTGEWLIGFGDVAGDESLSPTGDLIEAAARLFGALHRADAEPAARAIAVAPIPAFGLGIAIRDRLARAAAPRHSEGLNL